MEDRKINERESLELISDMIRKTKKGTAMKKDYNTFLIYGYTALITAIITWVTVHFTGRGEAMFTWFAMFIPYIANTFVRKSSKPEVTTYIDSMLGNIWKVIGSMFIFTVIAIVLIGVLTHVMNFSIMMPLSLIYAGIGTSMTGLVIKEKAFIWTPLAGLLAAVYMLTEGWCHNFWNILFGMSFLVFMIIPAHIARNKIKE